MEDCKPVITPMQTNQLQVEKRWWFKVYRSEEIQVNNSHPTICDNIQTRCNVDSWTGGTISRSTKGITCISSKEDFQISQRNIRVWIMVSKRKGSISYCLHRCRLGRLYWWLTKHQWSIVLLGWVFSIMAKKEQSLVSLSIAEA